MSYYTVIIQCCTALKQVKEQTRFGFLPFERMSWLVGAATIHFSSLTAYIFQDIREGRQYQANRITEIKGWMKPGVTLIFANAYFYHKLKKKKTLPFWFELILF